MLEIKTELLEMKAASFTLKQTIFREEKKIFELDIVLVYLSFDTKVQKLGKKEREFLLSLF